MTDATWHRLVNKKPPLFQRVLVYTHSEQFVDVGFVGEDGALYYLDNTRVDGLAYWHQLPPAPDGKPL